MIIADLHIMTEMISLIFFFCQSSSRRTWLVRSAILLGRQATFFVCTVVTTCGILLEIWSYEHGS